MLKRSLAIAATALFPFGAGAAPIGAFSDVVVFGDSLSDPGNVLTTIAGILGAPSPLTPLFPNDQITNGDTWATQLGLDLASGRNFAQAAARAVPTDPIPFEINGVTIPLDVPDFDAQRALFKSANPDLGTNSLALVAIGGNDIRDALASGDLVGGITSAVEAIVVGVGDLLTSGMDNVLVFGAPDLGLTPQASSLGISDLATTASFSFNTELRTQLASTFGPTPAIDYFDMFGFFNEIQSNSAAYGLTNTSDPCVFLILADPTATCDGFAFYDDLHPTEHVHGLLADAVHAQLVAPIPLPAGGLLLLSGLAGLGALARRRRRKEELAPKP